MRAGKSLHIILYLALSGLVYNGCVEQFEPETQAFENALVVDARLTDEEKNQHVVLSRTRRFEQEGVTAESNAQVEMVDNNGNSYFFREDSSGVYLSEVAFAAESGLAYELAITTSNGKSYRSKPVTAPDRTGIEGMYVERSTNDFGDEGVGIFLDNVGASEEPSYYRYEYEETFKIVAPFWDPFEFDVIDDTLADGDGFEVDIKARKEEAKVCYKTERSTDILLEDTQGKASNRLIKFPLRFLERNNYIISHRYSILVKQFTLDRDSYAFYSALDAFSSSESVFSEIQPGFFQGNIKGIGDTEDKVLGNFEVASVTQKRMFFNYADIFPNEALPPYALNCEPIGSPALYSEGAHFNGETGEVDGVGRSPLIQAIKAGLIVYYAENGDFLEQVIENGGLGGEAPFFTKSKACGDCRVLGTNVKPDFWIEE